MAPEKQKRATLVRPPLWCRKPVPNTDTKMYCGPLSRPENGLEFGAEFWTGGGQKERLPTGFSSGVCEGSGGKGGREGS